MGYDDSLVVLQNKTSEIQFLVMKTVAIYYFSMS